MGTQSVKKHSILQDTREQNPLFFYHPEIEIRVCKLNCGDYAMRFSDGLMSDTVFERKTIADAFGSLTSGYERFKREVQRAQETDTRLIVIIEGSLTKVFQGTRHSKVQGAAVVKTLFTLWHKYNVIPVFVRNRNEASWYIAQYYLAEWRNR